MDIITVALAIAMMGIIIAIGVVVAKQITITENIKKLFVVLIINVAVPSIILNGVFNTEMTDAILRQVFTVFGFSIVFNASAVLFAVIVGKMFRLETSLAKKLSLLAALGNTGFIGIPLSLAIFGPLGGLLAAVFDAGLDVILFSVGVYLLQSNQGFDIRQLKALLNPPLIAITFGMLFAVSGFEAPVLLQDLTAMLSGLAAPLAMFYIGFLLPPFFKKGEAFFFPQMWLPVSLKLLVIPLLAMPLILLLSLDGILPHLLILLSAMPNIMLAAPLFGRYTNDEDKAAMTTIYSTLLSLLTIPLVAWLANIVVTT
ncbi:AEC family transporter [Bacillus piscicola]|uniref:AEC family transporter n=1 Tax=Bacillus piscicola TaxID=1632684 RepID=UPI001F09D4A4|nr:AEC family transporter [Bacillus piscicola]